MIVNINFNIPIATEQEIERLKKQMNKIIGKCKTCATPINSFQKKYSDGLCKNCFDSLFTKG